MIKASEGNWVDNDGNPLSYANWHTNQPDNGKLANEPNEHWVHFGTSGKWNDVPRTRAGTHIVCVKPEEKVDEAAELEKKKLERYCYQI